MFFFKILSWPFFFFHAFNCHGPCFLWDDFSIPLLIPSILAFILEAFHYLWSVVVYSFKNEVLKSWLDGRIGELASHIVKRGSESSSFVGCSSCISQVSTFALSVVSFSKDISQSFAPILEDWLVIFWE